MDLLFKRYASPLVLLDQAIESCSLAEFVPSFVDIYTKEEEERITWEFYLHHEVLRESYADFRKRIGLEEKQGEPADDSEYFGTTIRDTVLTSRNILDSFKQE